MLGTNSWQLKVRLLWLLMVLVQLDKKVGIGDAGVLELVEGRGWSLFLDLRFLREVRCGTDCELVINNGDSIFFH